MWKFTPTSFSVQFPNFTIFWNKQWFLGEIRKTITLFFQYTCIHTNSKRNHQRQRRKRHYKQLLLLMQCEIIKLIIPGKTYTTTSINKEQRFPAASNFNKFDALVRNICLGSWKVCKTYIFHTEFCLNLHTGWNKNNEPRDQEMSLRSLKGIQAQLWIFLLHEFISRN
jgi:hypothetical protein